MQTTRVDKWRAKLAIPTRGNFFAALTCAVALAAFGCGGSDDDETEGAESTEDVDETESGDSTEGETPEPGTVVRSVCEPPSGIGVESPSAEEATNQAETIHYTRFVPSACTNDEPCSAIFLVSDGTMGGDEFFGNTLPRQLAAITGSIIIWHNAPGRGVGFQASGGAEDYNGGLAQDAFSSVVNTALKRQDTNTEIGIISFGFGLSTAAGALAKNGTTTLSDVDWLIDIEGPMNRCFISARPFDSDAGIDNDGPGAGGPKCDEDLVERELAFPTVGVDTPSVLCSEQAFPIAQTGKTCADDDWWNPREPAQALNKPNFKADYLRVQFEYDHNQATRWASIVGIFHGNQGGTSYTQLNNVPENTPLQQLGDELCLEQNCYLANLQGASESDGRANALSMPLCDDDGCTNTSNSFYADDPDYLPMDLDTFVTCILPNFITRMEAMAK